MNKTSKTKLKIVTEVGADGVAVLEARTIDRLLGVLFRRANRLVTDAKMCEKLKPLLREFVFNIIEYFDDTGDLDEYVMTNIMTALATSDSHGPGPHGVEDYSTFIRRLNPTDVDSDSYFIIGRAGRITDPGCPLKALENKQWRSRIPYQQLVMFHAFRYARSKDQARDAPRIPVWDLRRLIPEAINADSILEEAFVDVVFSDGAWELYQLRLAA